MEVNNNEKFILLNNMLILIMVILNNLNLYFILNIIDFISFDDKGELIILVIGGMILFIFPYADF
jgi:hypothetical protein